jgi:hypothetical protein
MPQRNRVQASKPIGRLIAAVIFAVAGIRSSPGALFFVELEARTVDERSRKTNPR